MKKLLYILGTRPEAIKLAPLINASRTRGIFDVRVCSTGQHKELLSQAFNFFEIVPDFNLRVMGKNQTFSSLMPKLISGIDDVVRKEKPDAVVVQGDTSTTFAGAFSAYHHHIPIIHIEAGLRSGDLYAPFPEEGYRAMISRLATYHFAPTKSACNNLKKEGIVSNVWVTGNTVVDALYSAKEKLFSSQKHKIYEKSFPFVKSKNKVILVTGHRRENFGTPLREICSALDELAATHKDIEIIYSMHLNPNVAKPVQKILEGKKRIHLTRPLEYQELVWMMDRAYFIITDSGGIQEEAPSFNKPVLVTRHVTERMEGVRAGCARLVGTEKKRIMSACSALLEDSTLYAKMAHAPNPYGDGSACEKIIDIMRRSI